jgi:hypothetical protein
MPPEQGPDQFASNIIPVIDQIKATSTTSLRGIALELNERVSKLHVVLHGTPVQLGIF